MKRSKPRDDKQSTRSRIDDDLITKAFEFQAHDLPRIEITAGKEKDFHDALVALVEMGCNPVTLCWAISLGAATTGKQVGPIPSAAKMKALTKSIVRLADEIERIEKSGFIEVIHREETSRWIHERDLRFEDVDDLGHELPQLDIQRWLRKKAEIYSTWVRLASENVRPKSGTMLSKLRYLYPALYVKSATGKTCSTELLELLGAIGISVDRVQLRRELTQLRRNYLQTYASMTSMLWIVKDRTFG
jgi:hypothetical protein